jgi:hypothetical protein
MLKGAITVNAIKILGIETFDYSKSKITADIITYWREIYWKDNSYLNRYKEVYENTI